MSAPSIQPADLAIALPLSTFFDHFQCAICLGEIQACHIIKECGHIFCESCIRECLNRKHTCPLCQTPTTVASLVKNPTFDQLLSKVKESTRKQSIKLVKKLLPNSPTAGPTSSATNDHSSMNDDVLPTHLPPFSRADSSLQNLSPIEQLFRTHVSARALLPFETVFQELKLSKEKLEQDENKSERSDVTAPGGATVIEHSTAASSSSAVPSFHSRALETVTHAYEEYLMGLPTAKFLEPIYFNITLVPNIPPAIGGNESQAQSSAASSSSSTKILFRLQSYLWEDLVHLIEKLIHESKQPDYAKWLALKAIPLDPNQVTVTCFIATQLPTCQVSFPMNPTLSDTFKSFHAWNFLKISPTSNEFDLIIKGAIEFVETAPLICFMQAYRPNSDQRVDYYKCQQCELNWICKSCSLTCHPGHTLTPFMLGHKPTYAACYCNKKRGCRLQPKK